VAALKFKNRLMSEMYETASGLLEAGVISKRRMGEFAALCQPALAVMTPAQIRALRKRCRLSQAVFASVLNASLSTVQKWETGAKRPGGPSLKLLSLIERKGLDVVL
jgi:putative transcriptional regulator